MNSPSAPFREWLRSVNEMSSESGKTAHAIVLMSGGLDSVLAAKVLCDQGIRVTGLSFVTRCISVPPGGTYRPRRQAGLLGIEIVTRHLGLDFYEMVRRPEFGRGRNLNPCIDCKIFMLKRAARLLTEIGADFLATGEVLGQRPMSQHLRALTLIEKESGLQGRLLRPLSAKHLPPTIPERDGLVDRERLHGISGRSRREQLELAVKSGLSSDDYSSPAGGCLLTENVFSARLSDLFDRQESISLADLALLRMGRHLRPRDGLKIAAGRNHAENLRLERWFSTARGPYRRIRPGSFPGPGGIAGDAAGGDHDFFNAIFRKYSKAAREVEITVSIEEATGHSDEITLPCPDPGTGQPDVTGWNIAF